MHRIGKSISPVLLVRRWMLFDMASSCREYSIQDSRQLYYLNDEKLMTTFAVKMELHYSTR